jgi:hypothetical protein
MSTISNMDFLDPKLWIGWLIVENNRKLKFSYWYLFHIVTQYMV